jgi:hypothetical protein
MKKDITDVCDYLKGLVIPHTPDGFVIAEPFRHGLPNDELVKGISAFRSFLYEFYGKAASDKAMFDDEKSKMYDIESGSDSIRDCFPIFNDIAVLLFSLGFYGNLETEPVTRLTVNGGVLYTPFIKGKPSAMKKLSKKRITELLNYLSEMGFYFEGLDLNGLTDLSKTGTFHVKNENDDYIILGLKLISEALGNVKAGFLKLASVFMRCDFYPLADTSPKDHTASAAEYANPQPPKTKAWIAAIEKHLLNNGCKISCFSLSNTNGDGSFSYASKKGSKVCSIGMDITGCDISIQGNNLLNEQNNILAELPQDMIDSIKKRAQKGVCKANKHKCKYKDHLKFIHNGEVFLMCRWGGFNFALNDESDFEVYRKWIDMELALYV